jgi:hypothetical protein
LVETSVEFHLCGRHLSGNSQQRGLIAEVNQTEDDSQQGFHQPSGSYDTGHLYHREQATSGWCIPAGKKERDQVTDIFILEGRYQL